MKYTNVTNIRRVGLGFQATVDFEGIGPIEFFAAKNDPMPHGVKIYEEIVLGKWGRIGADVDQSERESKDGTGFRNLRLKQTQWIVDRHRDEVELGSGTSISEVEYHSLLVYRKALRDWPASDSFPHRMPIEPAFLKKV